MRRCLHVAFLLIYVTAAFAANPQTITKSLTPFDPTNNDQDKAALKAITDGGTLSSTRDAAILVANTIGRDSTIDIRAQDFYCIIHILDWAIDVTTNPPSLKPGASNWYIYNPSEDWDMDALANNARIFGKKKPYILVIHRKVPANATYTLAYKVVVTPRTPANVKDLTDLASLIPAKDKAGFTAMGADSFISEWAYDQIDNAQPPSTLDIESALSGADKGYNLNSKSYQIDDEGLYRWDVSIGVPVKSYQQLQGFTGPNGLSQQEIDKRNAFAMLNVFLWPVDLKSNNFLAYPHLVAGVSMASKPLHGIFAGGGWGPTLANFYGGVLIVTDKSLDVPRQNDTHFKFGFGINFPIRAIGAKLGIKSQIGD